MGQFRQTWRNCLVYIGCLSYIKLLLAQGLLLHRIDVQLNLYISSLLTACLHTVTLHFKEYCNGILRNSGINCFWIVNNSLQVLSLLSTLNESSKVKHLDTFDFFTLYTKIPHDSLKCNLKVLINEAFRVRGARFLTVNRQGVAYWSVEPGFGFCFSFDKLLKMLEYLIDNIYIVVGNRVFQQHIGIYTYGN